MEICNRNFRNFRFHNKKSWRRIFSTFQMTELAMQRPKCTFKCVIRVAFISIQDHTIYLLISQNTTILAISGT